MNYTFNYQRLKNFLAYLLPLDSSTPFANIFLFYTFYGEIDLLLLFHILLFYTEPLLCEINVPFLLLGTFLFYSHVLINRINIKASFSFYIFSYFTLFSSALDLFLLQRFPLK